MTSPHHRGVRPPALVRLLLRLLLPGQDREFYLGDLEESGRRPWLREISGAVAFRLASGARRARAARRPVLGTAAGLVTGELRLGVRRLLKTPAATLTADAPSRPARRRSVAPDEQGEPGRSELDDGTRITAETARRLACDASLLSDPVPKDPPCAAAWRVQRRASRPRGPAVAASMAAALDPTSAAMWPGS